MSVCMQNSGCKLSNHVLKVVYFEYGRGNIYGTAFHQVMSC